MTRAKVWVEANRGGDALVEAVRARLTEPLPGRDGDPLPVEVIAHYGRAPLNPEPPGAHPVYTHTDGAKCIWVHPGGNSPGYWFVPYDVGGEGVECTKEHEFVDVPTNPKSFYFGFEPGELDTDHLRTITVNAWTDKIYLAPWAGMKPPVHAQWRHEPTGAVAVVCSPFDVPGEMTDELEDVTCADCLRAVVRIFTRRRR